jgi:hypothetical protein
VQQEYSRNPASNSLAIISFSQTVIACATLCRGGNLVRVKDQFTILR